MKRKNGRRHVVLMHHGMGDVVMALPMLSIVDASADTADEIDVIVKSDVEADLIRLCQWRHDLNIVSLQWSGSWSGWSTIRAALALRSTGVSTFLAPHAADSIAAAAFSRIIGAKLSIGPGGRFGRLGYKQQIEPGNEQKHKTLHYANYATAAGFNAAPPHCNPVLSPTLLEEAESLFSGSERGPRIVFAPMSSAIEIHKRWQLDNYLALGKALLDESDTTRIVVIGAPSERKELRELTSHFSEEKVALVTRPEIEHTLAHIKLADCVVSGCTGPMHLATLFDIPLVALYGPTDPFVTGPARGFFQVITSGLSCAPCYAPGFERGCEEPVCMTGIGVDKVLGSVKAALRQSTGPTGMAG